MFDRLKRKMRSPGETLEASNGSKALGNIALLHAYREKEAALAHVENNPVAKEQLSSDELEALRAEVEAGQEQFGSDIGKNKLGLAARQGEQFHIPDVEPTVTKVEDNADETVEAKDDEQVAA